VSVPETTQINGATVTKSVGGATIVEAAHSHSNGTASLHAKGEGGAYTNPRALVSSLFTSTSFRVSFSFSYSWLFR